MNSPSCEGLKTTQSSVFSIRIIEARLSISVAKFGCMSLHVEARYGLQSIRTQLASGSDTAPRWEEMHLLELTEAQCVNVKVLHKAVILGDVLVGECEIGLNRLVRRRNTDWWPLDGTKGAAGSIKVSFCFDDEQHPRSPSPPLTSPNLKDEVKRKQNELELEKEELEYYKLKYKRKAEELNQEKRRYRLRLQAIHSKAEEGMFSPTSHMEPADDLSRRQKSLSMRENSLVMERKRVREEREKVELERERVGRLREEVAADYAKLRREKQKLGAAVQLKRGMTDTEALSPHAAHLSSPGSDLQPPLFPTNACPPTDRSPPLLPLSERGAGRLLVFS